MKLVKSEEKLSFREEKINKILSKFAIGCLVGSISLGTLGAIKEIARKNEARSIPLSAVVSSVETEKLSGVVSISDDDSDVVKMYSFKNVDYTQNDIDYSNTIYSGVLFGDFFKQRPDLSVLYDKYFEELAKLKIEINDVSSELDSIESSDKEKYDELLSKQAELIEKRDIFNSKKDEIILMASDYIDKKLKLNDLNNRLNDMKQNNSNLRNGLEKSNDIYSIKLVNMNDSKIGEIENEISVIEEELHNYIGSSISVEDIKFLWNGYNSAYGYVPAGEWDSWLNPNYAGGGHLTGLIGSFQGMQGTETGYDSRKGAEKLNYGDPDRALLKLLAEVKDSEGNYLFPMESFEKGGKYYYHIFGINDDGSIDYDLIDNPRFGLKMLGNYFIVGGDQRLLRERGSFILTSLGPAIIFDNGEIPDLDVDPNHIDMSMDEVLFWLKNYSHNSDMIVKSMAGIYDWCTPDDFSGVVDVAYEIMERNYVNNLSITYDVDLICFFDREEFFTETTYNGQDDFVLKLNR